MSSGFETDRLILRPFQPTDAEAAFGWFGDPVVMRFTPTGPDQTIEQTRERIENYIKHQSDHSFSKWLIEDRSTGFAIGDSGLFVLKDCGWIDLGFRFARPYWGKGLATEAASMWVRAAFHSFHIARLGAFVHPENSASIRVLEKLGFHEERRDSVMGMESIVYSLDANLYEVLSKNKG